MVVREVPDQGKKGKSNLKNGMKEDPGSIHLGSFISVPASN